MKGVTEQWQLLFSLPTACVPVIGVCPHKHQSHQSLILIQKENEDSRTQLKHTEAQ